MKSSDSCQKRTISRRALLLLFALVLLVYSNTFYAEWHFDDRHSIVDNDKVHISEITMASLSQAIQHPDTKRVWRPIAYLSFALNWYFGQNDVTGYHIVNILIHFITSLLLYRTLLLLFQSPVLAPTSIDKVRFISLFTVVLWAVNPIQTQAVTYIVQRMTLLSALFYISGIYFYMKARLTLIPRYSIINYILFVVCWVLGLASKENAILLPLGVALVEGLFFHNPKKSNDWKKYLFFFSAGCLAVCILGVIIYIDSKPLSLFSGYSDRFFTLPERVMTQPRVLIYYLSQILFPHPARLSIEHEFAISTSLIYPWTTFPSILLLIGLIVTAVLAWTPRPLLSFAILFFFFNHAIESSIVPLEIAFEHRNYLPTMFFFAPVAEGTVWLLNRYNKIQPGLYWIIVSIGICLIAGFGIGTYHRNRVWQTEGSLWSDAHHKAPSMHRPVHNLAMAVYDRRGRFDKALELYHLADRLRMHRRSHKAILLSNIANIYHRTGRYSMAETYYRRAHEIAPKKKFIRFRLAETLTRQQKWKSGMAEVDALLMESPRNSDYLNLKGIIQLNRRQPEQALLAFRAAIKNDPQHSISYINAGRALVAEGKFSQAEKLYRYSIELTPGNLKTYVRLLVVYLKRDDVVAANNMGLFLVDSASVHDLALTLEELTEEPFFDLIDYHNAFDILNVALGKIFPKRYLSQ